MSTEVRCSKCGNEPRSAGSSWGKACLAAQAKERRMRRGATGDPVDATSHVAPPVALPSHDVASRVASHDDPNTPNGWCLDCPECLARLELLERAAEMAAGKDATIAGLTKSISDLEHEAAALRSSIARLQQKPEAGMIPGPQIYPVPIRHGIFEHAWLVPRPMSWERLSTSSPLPEFDPPTTARCVSRRGQAICSCGMYELRWAER